VYSWGLSYQVEVILSFHILPVKQQATQNPELGLSLKILLLSRRKIKSFSIKQVLSRNKVAFKELGVGVDRTLIKY